MEDVDKITQVLRTIDKLPKLGVDGVVKKLQEPIETFGANLSEYQAKAVGNFLECKGATNEETLHNMGMWFAKNGALNAAAKILSENPEATRVIKDRFDYIDELEADINENGISACDRLLAMPKNENQTWENGGRPANIAYAIDDLRNGIVGKDAII